MGGAKRKVPVQGIGLGRRNQPLKQHVVGLCCNVAGSLRMPSSDQATHLICSSSSSSFAPVPAPACPCPPGAPCSTPCFRDALPGSRLCQGRSCRSAGATSCSGRHARLRALFYTRTEHCSSLPPAAAETLPRLTRWAAQHCAACCCASRRLPTPRWACWAALRSGSRCRRTSLRATWSVRVPRGAVTPAPCWAWRAKPCSRDYALTALLGRNHSEARG